MTPSASRSPALAVGLVLGLCVLAFALGAARSGTSGVSWLSGQRIRHWLSSGRRVQADELLGTCTRRLGEFRFTGSCVLGVAEASAWTRTLQLTPKQRVRMRTLTLADGRRFEAQEELEPAQTRELRIGRDGRSLTLVCLAPTACTLQIL